MSLIMNRTMPEYRAHVAREANRPHVASTFVLVALDMEDEGEATSVLGRGLSLSQAMAYKASFAGMLPDGIKLVVVPTGAFDLT